MRRAMRCGSDITVTVETVRQKALDTRTQDTPRLEYTGVAERSEKTKKKRAQKQNN